MNDKAKGLALLTIVRAFVTRQTITCPETIYQTDRVIENAYEFIEELCDVAGYHRDPDDEEGLD